MGVLSRSGSDHSKLFFYIFCFQLLDRAMKPMPSFALYHSRVSFSCVHFLPSKETMFVEDLIV